jgi:hypothetical protein
MFTWNIAMTSTACFFARFNYKETVQAPNTEHPLNLSLEQVIQGKHRRLQLQQPQVPTTGIDLHNRKVKSFPAWIKIKNPIALKPIISLLLGLIVAVWACLRT